jgi:glycosyltransferase involved in cell wall biosynthesis
VIAVPARGTDRMSRLLMLVSARADDLVREQVAADLRPCPEYLVLERDHGIELLDWSRLPGQPRARSAAVSALHVASAAARLGRFDAVFTDGEHLGILLSLVTSTVGPARPHLMLGHHLTSKRKERLTRWLRGPRGATRILVHSRRQLELAVSELRIPEGKLALVPYHADTDFWRPLQVREEALVVAAGREHRDYRTLAAALGDLPVEVFVAAGSAHSPASNTSLWPATWPANFSVEVADYRRLRDFYARASVVAVPLVETDFQAGITVVLEAMAMAKAVVVTDTSGKSEAVVHGHTGLVVPSGDAAAMRDAVNGLMGRPDERARLGRNARAMVTSRFSLGGYAATLAGHLREVAAGVPARS